VRYRGVRRDLIANVPSALSQCIIFDREGLEMQVLTDSWQ